MIVDNRQNLCLILKRLEDLGRDWDSTSMKSVVNFLLRPNKVQELIELISNDKEVEDMIRTIHFQDIFPIMYDISKSANIIIGFSTQDRT